MYNSLCLQGRSGMPFLSHVVATDAVRTLQVRRAEMTAVTQHLRRFLVSSPTVEMPRVVSNQL